MNALRPSAKAGIVLLGFIVALAIAWFAVAVRQHFTQGPEAQASAGMYAAGDAMLGVAVFGLLALLPTALALYWLRPVERFWSVLGWSAVGLALTGLLALGARMGAGTSKNPWLFLADARIALMPLTTLAFLTCAIFTPQSRSRRLLLGAALSDGLLFGGIVLVHFVLPSLGR